MISILRKWLGNKGEAEEKVQDESLEEPLQSFVDTYLENPKRFICRREDIEGLGSFLICYTLQDKDTNTTITLKVRDHYFIHHLNCHDTEVSTLLINGKRVTLYKESSIHKVRYAILKERSQRFDYITKRKEKLIHEEMMSLYCKEN